MLWSHLECIWSVCRVRKSISANIHALINNNTSLICHEPHVVLAIILTSISFTRLLVVLHLFHLCLSLLRIRSNLMYLGNNLGYVSSLHLVPQSSREVI